MNTRVMTDKLQGFSKKAGETAKTVGQVTDRYVHENTWSSLAFAAVIGALIGFMLGNRRGD